MNYSPVVIVSGEPNRIFLEIFFKAKKKKLKDQSFLLLLKS